MNRPTVYYSIRSCLRDGTIRAGTGFEAKTGRGVFLTVHRQNGKPCKVDYHQWDEVARTPEQALQMAEDKRQGRIDAVTSQLVRLRKLKFGLEDNIPKDLE